MYKTNHLRQKVIEFTKSVPKKREKDDEMTRFFQGGCADCSTWYLALRFQGAEVAALNWVRFLVATEGLRYIGCGFGGLSILLW